MGVFRVKNTGDCAWEMSEGCYINYPLIFEMGSQSHPCVRFDKWSSFERSLIVPPSACISLWAVNTYNFLFRISTVD